MRASLPVRTRSDSNTSCPTWTGRVSPARTMKASPATVFTRPAATGCSAAAGTAMTRAHTPTTNPNLRPIKASLEGELLWDLGR